MHRGAFASWSRALGGCALVAGLAPAVAHAETGYAGTYTATPARIEAQVTTWGPDCGVRPQSYTASDRPKVVVTDQGAHLALTYPDHTLKTSACWTPNPNVKLTSATAADDRWRSECRTALGDPKKETGRYTVNAASPTTLELVEESEYDWQLKDSHCTAKVRITQTLERPATASTPKPATGPTPAPEPLPEPKTACVAGAITRIKLRPAEARVEPGQRLCFSIRGVDAQGCPTDVDGSTLAWELKKPSAARGALKDGCFKAADSAADAEGTFRVVATKEALHAEAAITVAAPDLSDITARRGATSQGLAETPMSESRATSGAGVKALGVEGGVRPWMWGVAAALLGLLAAVAVVLARRRTPEPAIAMPRASAAGVPRPSAPQPRITEPEPPTPVAPPPAGPVVPAATPINTEPLICPTCRHGYAPGTTRCAKDGSIPIAYSEFLKRAREAEARPRACPHCGARLATDAAFCGECGKRTTP